MRFSTIIFPLAVLAGLVLASPSGERATSANVTPVDGDVKPTFAPAVGKVRPAAAVHAQSEGVTGPKPGVSKRSDYNELDGRATQYAVLVLCSGYSCTGSCYGYYLPVNAWTCYGAVTYNSLYVWAVDGLTYGVYVGTNCNGQFRSYAFSERLAYLTPIVVQASLSPTWTRATTSTPRATLTSSTELVSISHT